jgi:FkbM family methyltransferase
MSFWDLTRAVQQTVAVHFLSRQRVEYNRRFPQMAVLPFDHIGIEIACKGRYEEPAIRAIRDLVAVRRNRVAIDVGANIGNHAVAFSESFEEVVALEPNDTARELLEMNTAKFSNITVISFGVSNRNARVRAQTFTGNLGGTTILGADVEDPSWAAEESTVTLRVKRLDDILDEKLHHRIDLVKLDVEGHEIQALEGMTTILRTSRPVVAIELLRRHLSPGGESAALDVLRAVGYEHFYEVRHVTSRIPDSTWRYVRRPLRLIELLLKGPLDTVRLVRMSHPIERKNYRLVLCSHVPLIRTRT